MEFLLCNVDLGDYEPGDIINVQSDGFNWGEQERNSERFKIVRVPDSELGNKTVAELQELYVKPSIYLCSLCNKYVLQKDVQTHIDTEHADVEPATVDLSIAKNCVWKINLTSHKLEEKDVSDPSTINVVEHDTLTITEL